MDEPFTAEEVERASRYHRPLDLAWAGGAALDLALFALIVFTGLGAWLFSPLGSLPWWAQTPLYSALVIVLATAVTLPLAYWAGHARERAWGFSTQSARGWAADQAKGLAVGVVLGAALLTGLVGLARALPTWWPVAAAVAACAVVVLLGFVAPVVLEPLFNRFTPLADEELAADLRRLADEAGVPVEQVLVADASRQTTKVNAYVSGIGRTRRLVVYDTLLGEADRRELRLVLAHELGHRRAGHLAKGIAASAAGLAFFVAVLWASLQWQALLDAAGLTGPGDPRAVPLVLLLGSALGLLSDPARSALSRRWEYQADRISLELTHDLGAFESTHRRLAVTNLSDLAPPRIVYLWRFSHPTPPERIAFGRRVAASL